ncbi:GGDEF domain-containing protein, partial [bacterium]
MNELNSLHDRLTGLPSREYVLRNLDGILGHNGQIVFMIADIDSCKTFNYSSGYINGDEEIIKVGREIRKLVGKNPI